MKKTMSRLGFTLIELLIVITIIGILAVVFLPTVLDAPRKARDAARKADIGNLVEGIEAARLDGKAVSDLTTGCVKDGVPSAFVSFFGGGTVPHDPKYDGTDITVGPGLSCTTDYGVVEYTTSATQKYAYGVFSKVENWKNGNIKCSEIKIALADTPTALAPLAADPTPSAACYAAYSQ